MGGPQNVEPGQPDWLTAEIAFIKAAHDRALPVVGICLGSQMLAAALGGRSARCPSPRSALPPSTSPSRARPRPCLAGIPWSHAQLHSHGFHVSQLPPGATLLASSALCKVQAFKAGIRSYGFQFHPECDKPQMDAMIAVIRRASAKQASRCPTLPHRPRSTIPPTPASRTGSR